VGAVTNADQLQKQQCGTIQPLVLNGGTDLMMNTKTKPFNDIRVRQAVAMAIDPADYSKIVTAGLIAPTKSIFRTDSPFYDPNILQPAYDPVKAQQLFDAAAADLGGTISFTITTFPVLNYQNTATYVQAALNKFNHVKADLQTEASAQHITNASTSNFTMSVFGNIFDDPEPTWTSINTCTGVPNYTGFCNAQYDADVADNQVTLDPAKRIADIKDAQKVYYAQVPMLFVEQRYSWVFTAPNIQDFHFVNDGLPLLDRLWIKSHS
jgi:peptide/nickel transport system substrate-binding protein